MHLVEVDIVSNSHFQGVNNVQTQDICSHKALFFFPKKSEHVKKGKKKGNYLKMQTHRLSSSDCKTDCHLQ